MVIGDEIFEHRERLKLAVLRAHGLPEEMVRRWQALEEFYRTDIVKQKPWNRTIGGVEVPVDGFGQETLSSDGLCDGCGREVKSGESVTYHLRIGSIYCGHCRGSAIAAPPVRAAG